jgi:hypothetical protein
MRPHGGIKGKEHRGLIAQQRDRRYHQTNDHQPECRPAKGHALQWRVEGVHGRQREKAADEKRRPHQDVHHPMQAEPMIVRLDQGGDLGIKVDPGVLERLEESRHHPDEEGDEGDDQIGRGQPVLCRQGQSSVGGAWHGGFPLPPRLR